MDLELIKIAEEVEDNSAMSGKIKYDLREKINALTPIEHICIFKIVLKFAPKKVYTATNSGTFFDLNDLDNRTLWKIEKLISLTLQKIQEDKKLEKLEHEKKISELAMKTKVREKKTEETLIPRNKQKTSTTTSNSFLNEIIGQTKDPEVFSKPMNLGESIDPQDKGFIASAACITEDDIASSQLADNARDNEDDEEEAEDIEGAGEEEEEELEEEEEEEEEEELEEEEEEEELDPSKIILNGGQHYYDKD